MIFEILSESPIVACGISHITINFFALIIELFVVVLMLHPSLSTSERDFISRSIDIGISAVWFIDSAFGVVVIMTF